MNLDKHHHHLSFDRNASFVPFELTQKKYYKPFILFHADAKTKKSEPLQVANTEEEKHPHQLCQETPGSKNEKGKGKRETGPSGSLAPPLVLASITWLNTEEKLPSVSHRTESFCLCLQCNSMGQPEEIYSGT